jgi:hypothetical protein
VCRGASGAPGRTSWRSIAEQNDYISFIGFMVTYLDHIQPPAWPIQFSEYTKSELEVRRLSPISSQAVPLSKSNSKASTAPAPNQNDTRPLLLLAGYSYGALITARLPPILASILNPFQTPITGSPHAEIRLRAGFIADQQNKFMNESFSTLHSDHAQDEAPSLTSASVRGASANAGDVQIGGHEDLPKSTHESHRSRTSMPLDPHVKEGERGRRIARSAHFGHRTKPSSAGSGTSSPPMQETKGPERSSEVTAAQNREALAVMPNVGDDLSVAYLLVSPLHGWVNSLATMSPFVTDSGNSVPEHEMKLTVDPTLALFGDDDVFVSVNKLRAWAEKMHAACERKGNLNNFMHREIPGAGHFWHHHEAMQILRDEVKLFVSSL